MGNFVTVETTKSDSSMSKISGTVNWGFNPKTGDVTHTTTVTIAVDDIRESRGRIARQGGKISGEIMNMPGIGMFMSFFDTDGNRVNLIQLHARQG